jgi:serine/threonine protein kinase
MIERLVGRGGMGEVFAGRALGLEGFSRAVAIKRIHSQYGDERALRSMFVAEARLTARLSHGNIVAVHDLEQDQAGRLFLVMELVDGIDLASLLRTGALPLPVALFVTCEILRGLGHAHDLPASDDSVRGLVHRDVSPQNMLIGWDGAVKVSDFGLAKARARIEASASLLVKGKIAYMSPEQANGAALDGRSDLFSVGVMLWEMICGARLFGRSTLEATVRSVLAEPIPSPCSRSPGLPRDLERVTMRLLARDRGRRYPTAGAAREALLACAAYPKNGRELLSALLGERLPTRARPWSAEGAGLQRSSLDEETTLAPPVAHPAPPRSSIALVAVSVIATALAAILVGSLVMRGDDHGAPAVPAARVAPSVEPQASPPQPGEAPAITATSAPLPPPPIPAVPVAPAPTMAPQDRPTSAPIGRRPARGRKAPRAPGLEQTRRQGMHVIDLRDLAPATSVRGP